MLNEEKSAPASPAGGSGGQNQNSNENPPVQNQQTQAPNPTVEQNQPKRKFSLPKIMFMVMVFLLLLTLTGGTYFLGKNSVNNTSLTPTSSPTPTPDPTADWEMYTSEFAGYSFKYPFDWIDVDEDKNNVTPEFTEIRSPDYTETEGPGAFLPVTSGFKLIIRNEENPNFSDYEDYKKFILESSTGHVQRNDENVSEKDIAGFKCLYSKNIFIYDEYNSSCSTYYNGKTIDLNVYSASENGDIFDQILSTFQFIEEATSILDLPREWAWITYNDPQGKYSFEYPSAMEIINEKQDSVDIQSPDYESSVAIDYNDGIGFSLERKVLDENETLETIMKSWRDETAGTSKFTQIQLGNNQAYKFHVDFENHSLWYITINDGFEYRITVNTRDLNSDKEYEEIINRIVNSFNFTQ